jgi:hypothetical protein
LVGHSDKTYSGTWSGSLGLAEAISRQYQELDLYLRQSHGERDLEILGTDVKTPSA